MLLSACASKPPLLGEDLRADVTAVSIAPTRLADGGWKLDSDSVKAMTSSAGALQGGAGGALTAANLFRGACEGAICGAAALVWLTAVATGALIGAVQGAGRAHEEQQEARRLESLRGSFDSVVASLDVVGGLHAQLLQTALDVSRLALPVPAADDGGATVILVNGEPAEPRYSLDTNVRNISFDAFKPPDGPTLYSLGLFVRYRLIARDDGKVLYESFAYVRCGPWSFETWARNDAQLLLTTLPNMYRQIAEAIVDDTLRIYRSNDANSPTTESGRGYFLDAVYPPSIGKPFPMPEHSIGFGLAGTQEIAERQPRLRWTAVPHRAGNEQKKEKLDIPEKELRYDVRVFKDGLVVESADALARPEYRLQAALEPCHGYFWTFRARFTLDNRTRVTDWSQPYVGWLEPWNSRYPLVPGLSDDRDVPGVYQDRTQWYQRFWINGPCPAP
jgi:hypothetical protein